MTMSTFPERLRRALEVKGWTQGELAGQTGVGASTVSQWLKGARTPEGDHLERLARALDTQPSWLLDGEGPEPAGARRHAWRLLERVVGWVPRRAHRDGGR